MIKEDPLRPILTIGQTTELQKTLTELLGLHRQLLEILRQENQALVSSDLKEIQEITYSKEVLTHTILAKENERRKIIPGNPPLSEVILEIQNFDTVLSDQLRNLQNSILVLMERMQAQNTANSKLVDNALHHLHQMKRNIIGPAGQDSSTYSSKGKSQTNGTPRPRLLAQEA